MQSYTIKSFADADELLTGRCKDRRKIANNTWLERHYWDANGPAQPDDEIAVRLHATDIVTYRADGAITLDTGGWFTVTTKARMCEFSPFSITSNRGEWQVHLRNLNYVNHFTGDYRDNPYWLAESVPYRDHMTWLNGSWSGIPTPDQLDDDRAARKQLHADIKKFVDGITPERIIDAWENNLGDCFLCRAGIVDEHLASHVEENYFHASLMHSAVNARHFGNPEFIMQMIYRSAQQGVVEHNFCKTTLTKFLRKALTQGVAVAR